VFVALAALTAAGLKTLSPLAQASDPSRLVAPTSSGTVDFGDRVAYRLEGPSCDGERARVVVRAGVAGREVLGTQSTARPDPLAPTEFSLRTGSATGPRLVGPVDIADDYLNDWKSIDGWPNCWQLLPWPVTGEAPARAPELYVTVDTAPEPVLLSWIDFNGTG